MKRKLVILTMIFVLVLGGLALAQTWHTTNQATVAWDAVPVPAGSTVEYVVYLANATTDPDKTNPVEIATTTDLDQLITLNVEGSYFVGVKARRILDADGSNVGESTVAWSDDPQYCQNGETFGLRYFVPPDAPVNMRPV